MGEANMVKRGRTNRKPHPGGRPTVVTPEVKKKICRYISQGLPYEQAASRAGISVSVFYAHQSKFPEFSEAIKKAKANFVNTHVQRITRASRKSWTASAWLLERCCPEEFGKLDRNLIRKQRDGKHTGPLPQDYIDAVNRALGYTGQMIPIGTPPPGENNDDTIDLDVLPE